MVGLTPRHTYNASLGLVLRALAHMRAGGALLHAAEWRMYSKALHTDCVCQRMAAVASVSGDSEEVCCLCRCPGTPCTCQLPVPGDEISFFIPKKGDFLPFFDFSA